MRLPNWIKHLLQHADRGGHRRRRLRRGSGARPGDFPALEIGRFEERCVLDATLTVLPGGAVNYQAAAGQANTLQVSFDGGEYTFVASGETINLVNTSGVAASAGSADTVKVGSAPGDVTGIAVDLGDGVDSVAFGGLNTVPIGPGGLSISAENIGQTVALDIAGTTSLTSDVGGSIMLDASGNDFQDAVSVASGAGVDVSLVDQNGFQFGASNLGGSLSLTAKGLIGQNAAITVAGPTRLSAGAGNNIDLSLPDNDFVGGVTILTGDDVALRDANALTLAGVTISGDLTAGAGAQADGDLLVDRIVTGGTLGLGSLRGTIDEDGAGDAAVDLQGSSLSLAARDGIGQGDPLEVSSTAISAGSLTSGDVRLSNIAAGPVTVSNLTSAGAIEFTQTGGYSLSITSAVTAVGNIDIANDGAALTLGDADTGGAGGIRLKTAISGDVTIGALSADGNLAAIQSAGELIDGNGAQTNITAADLVVKTGAGVGVADALETLVDRVEAEGGSGGVVLANGGDLQIGGVSGVTGISTAAAPIDITATGSITVGEQVGVSVGPAAITLRADGPMGDLVVEANVASMGRAVALLADRNVSSGPAGAIDSAGGKVIVSADDDDAGGGTITYAAPIDPGGGDLDLHLADADGEISAPINGSGAVNKLGGGAMALSAANTYSGQTNVEEGTLLVEGSIAGTSVEVGSGATLGGSGSISTAVNVGDGGTLAPGASSGLLTVNGGQSFAAGSTFSVEIDDDNAGGAVAGVDYDQLAVNGLVDIGATSTGATLAITTAGSTAIAAGDAYVLLANDAAEAIDGRLTTLVVDGNIVAAAGVAEGTVVSTDFGGSGLTARLTYLGGDGNDLAIVVDGPLALTLDGITIVERIDGTDSLRVLNAANDAQNLGDALAGVLTAFTVVDARPIASIDAGGVQVVGGAGDDILIVDLAGFLDAGGANLTGTIDFDGRGQAAGDQLYLNDPTSSTVYDTIVHRFDDADSGRITIDRDGAAAVFAPFAIHYTGLEPITQNVAAANVTLDYDAGDDAVTLTDEAGQLRASAGAAETLTFTAPTDRLTILGGDGDDRISISDGDNRLDNLHAALVVDGEADADTLEFAADLLLGSGGVTGALSAVAETITMAAGVAIDATGGAAPGPVTISGGMSIALAGGNSLVASAITLDGEDGAIALNAATLTAMTGDVVIKDSGPGAPSLQLGDTSAAGGALVLGVAAGGEQLGGDVMQAPATAVNAATLTGVVAGALDLSGTANSLDSVANLLADGAIAIDDATGGLLVSGVDSGGYDIAIETSGGDLALDNLAVTALGATARLASTDGAITDNQPGDGAGDENITADAAALRAATGIGSDDALDTNVAQLAVVNTAQNDIRVANTAAQLALTSIDAVAGVQNQATGDPGTITVSSAGAIDVLADGGVLNSSGGDILLTSLAGDLTLDGDVRSTAGDASATLTAAGAVVQHASSTVALVGAGAITFRSAEIDLTGGAIDAGPAGSVRFFPSDPTLAMHLGGDDTPYGLTDAELTSVQSAARLVFGESGVQSGAVHVTTVVVPVATATIEINTTGPLTLDDEAGQAGAATALQVPGSGGIEIHLAGGDLVAASADNNFAELAAGGAILLESTSGNFGASGHAVQFTGGQDEVEIRTDAGDVFLAGTTGNATDLTLLAVDADRDQGGAAGDVDVRVDAPGSSLTVGPGRAFGIRTAATGTVALSAADGVTLHDAVTTAGGTVTIDADSDDDAAGALVTSAGGAIHTAGGDVDITAADVQLADVVDTVGVASSAGVRLATSTSGRTIGLGGGSGAFQLDDGELDFVSAFTLEVGVADSGEIRIDDASYTPTVPEGDATMILQSGGGVFEEGADPDVDLQVSRLVAIAAGGFGEIANPLESRLDRLEAQLGGEGLLLENMGPLTIGAIGSLVGITTAGGDARITATGGITVDEMVDALGGDIALTAVGTNADVLLQQSLATTGAGVVSITADDSVMLLADGDIFASGGGGVSIAAGGNAPVGDDGERVTMADGATVDAGSGTILLSTDGGGNGDVTVGRLVTTNGGTAAVTIQSAGGVIDGGDTGGEDIVAPAGMLAITARDGVGDGNPLETQVDRVTIANTVSGQIAIDEFNALGVHRIDQDAAGDVSVVAGGTITLAAGAGTGGITALDGVVQLSAVGAASSLQLDNVIGTRGGDVDLDAGFDVTSSAGGAVTTTAAADSGAASGRVAIDAGSAVNLAGAIDTRGADHATADASSAGHVDITAGGALDVGDIDASGGDATGGSGDGGDAGDVNLMAGPARYAALHGAIRARGGVSFSAVGGAHAVVSIAAGGALIDGDDGRVDVDAGGLIVVATGVGAGAGTDDVFDARVDRFAAKVGAGGIEMHNELALEIAELALKGVTPIAGVSTADADALFDVAGSLTFTSRLDVGAATAQLTSDGGIAQTASGGITAQSLGVRQLGASGAVSLGFDNHVGVLAMLNVAPLESVAFRNLDDLTVGAVAGHGAFAATAGVTTVDGDAAFDIGGFFHLDRSVNVGAADVRLLAGADVMQTAVGTIGADKLGVRTNGGEVRLDAPNDVDVLAVDSALPAGAVTFRDADDLTLGAVSAKAEGGIAFDPLSGVTTSDGDALLAAGGFFYIAQPLNVGTGDVRIVAGGEIGQSSAGAILANELGLRQVFDDADDTAGVDIVLGNAPNDIDELDVENRDVGGAITFVDSGDTAIEELAGQTVGAVSFLPAYGLTAFDGDIAVTSLGGTMTAARPVVTTGGGDITLTALASPASGVQGNIDIRTTLASIGGNVHIAADAGVTFGPTGRLATTSGDILVRAEAQGAGNGGAITMADRSMIESVSGEIDLRAASDITLAGVRTGASTATAVYLSAAGGGLRDGGDSDVDIASPGMVTIVADTGVGDGGDSTTDADPDADLETQIAALRVDNRLSGDVAIDEVDDLSIVRLMQSGGGFVDIDAGGTITVAAFGDGVQSTGGGSVTLDAEGDLVFDDATLTSVTGSGKIFGYAGPTGGNRRIVIGAGAVLQTATGSIGQKITGLDVMAVNQATGSPVPIDTTGVSTVSPVGETTVVLTLQDPHGVNFRLRVQWGDGQDDNFPGYPDPNRPLSFGTNMIQPPATSLARIDAGDPVVLQKRYNGNPNPNNPRANIPVRGQIEYDAQGESDNGIQLFENGATASARIVIPFAFQLVVPGAGLYRGAIFMPSELVVRQHEPPPVVTPPVPVSVPILTQSRQITEVVLATEVEETEQDVLVLVVVDAQGNEGNPILLNADLLRGNGLVELLRGLPNGRYRVKFKPAGGLMQVLFDLIVDQGRLTDVSQQSDEGQADPDSGGAAIERGREGRDTVAAGGERSPGEAVPAQRSAGYTDTSDTNASDTNTADSERLGASPEQFRRQSPDEPPPQRYAPEEFVRAAQRGPHESESLAPAVSKGGRLAAPLGGAVVLAGAAADQARQHWHRRVDEALESGRTSLGKAARLLRRARK